MFVWEGVFFMTKTDLPVILLRGIIVLPYAELKIDLIDELDTKIIELASQNHDGYVLLVSPLNYLEERIEINKLPKLGVVGKITKRTTLPNGCIRVTIEGKKRAVINGYMPYVNVDDAFVGNISAPTRYAIDASDEEALVRKLKQELENYITIVPYASNSILGLVDEINTVSRLADVVANYMPITFERKHEFLTTVNPHTRVMMNLEDIQKELDVFEIEIFSDFHTKLMEFSIGEFELFRNILGMVIPNIQTDVVMEFGSWYLFNYSIVLAFVTIFIWLVSRMKWNDFLSNAWEGMKKVAKPIAMIVFAYMLFVLLFWSSILPTIINELAKITDSFNPFIASLQAFIAGFFNSYCAYIGYNLSYYLSSFTGNEGNVIALIFSTIYGLVQFITPISIFLLFGLSYMDIPYKKWMGYIWKFVLGMLVCLLIIFALLTYI